MTQDKFIKSNIFKLVTAIFTIGQFLILPVLPVSAHFLLTDGDIGITLHVDPDDDPIVGQPTKIYPDLKDKSGKFQAKNCDCKLSVSRDGQNIAQFQFSPGIGTDFLFDKKGVYALDFSGQATDSSFPNFKIHYDLNVNREIATQQTAKPVNHTAHYVIFGSGFALFAIIIGKDIIQKKRSEKKSSNTSS